MRRLWHKAQETTAALGPELRAAFAWGQEAAESLEPRAQQTAEAVRRRSAARLDRRRVRTPAAGALQGALEPFLKVTQSYWPGRFHGYDVQGLPRTNNAIEHFFGTVRHRERRCRGPQPNAGYAARCACAPIP
jgi:hypothetical protein